MELGYFCREGKVDCLIMMISLIVVLVDTIRLICQLILTSRQNSCPIQSNRLSSVKQHRGQERKLVFLLKIFGIFLIMVISIAQILIWVLDNDVIQSIILVQMFSTNIFSSILWILAIFQDKKQKGYTKKWTQVNMHINLLCNILIALLSARSQFDNHEDISFYSYLGYIATSGIHQIYIKACQKDFNSISLDELIQKESIQSTANNNSNPISTKVETNKLTEKLLDKDESFNEQKEKQQDNHYKNSNEICGFNDVCTNINKNKKDKINIYKKQKKNQQNIEDLSKKCGNIKLNQNDNKENCDMNFNNLSKDEEDNKQCKSKFENIRIERFLETIKYSKKTIVYEIKCTYKGKIHSVKRSFREFGALNNTLKHKCKNKKLPSFPQKKAQNSILTFNDLEERKKQLCIFLQNISLHCDPEDLIEFMTQNESASPSSVSKSPLLQQQDSRNQQKKSIGDENQNNIQYNQNNISYNQNSALIYTIPDIIWEEEEELTLSTSSQQ